MPDPLVAAAEALLDDIWWRDDMADDDEHASCLVGKEAVAALRAALAAHRQLDERAEAAVADVLAENDRLRAALEAGFAADDNRALPALERAADALTVWLHEEAAARRRWAEVEGRRA